MSKTDQDSSDSSSGSTFQAYKGTTLDAPLFHFVLAPVLHFLRPCLSAFYRLRWELSRPLQVRLLPIPLINLPWLRDLPSLTLGQLILCAPLALLLYGGYYYTYVLPLVGKSGSMATYAMFLCFLTANKSNSIIAFLLGIPFERMIPFHNLSSLVTVVLSCLHGYCAYLYSGDEDPTRGHVHRYHGSDPNPGKFLIKGGRGMNLSGTVLTGAIGLLILTSFFPIFRRKCFDAWLIVHILCVLCVIMASFMHEIYLIAALVVWWFIDLGVRYFIMAGSKYPTQVSLELVASDVVKVVFTKPKSFEYNAGQFVQIAFKDLGVYAFHPISISSAPHEPEVTLHVRGLGGWSNKLVELANENKQVSVFMEGPYGSLSVNVDDDNRYQMALCVSGGIGVTHCESVAKSLLHQQQHQGRKLQHLKFVWALRELELLDVMKPLEGSADRALEAMETAELTTELSDSGEIVMELANKTADAPKRITQTDIYWTKPTEGASLPSLKGGQKFHNGRPDPYAIVEEMKEMALDRDVQHVAVFVCGPKTMVDQMKDACRKHSSLFGCQKGVQFDVHEEMFSF